ncbi:fumarylacetoacetase [Paracidovorax citrulli]|uniref:fumarylacetoacetase n=2 Tax=Paracidovorax citrulli TaxID=80869 RepID=A1TIS5_PARC0|nr:fumarylacetoacetase [Paracidovorax citrulli]ABM30863.1 fumarylacetoacetate hydrolase [Paracidovorax citrulli AAC00-1]ATG95964.1 fumarylacetoacetase [Paracidovorax citrulli]PVY65039.1 fumarylacetoacetate hydrolase [Paracidovorax citrulli]REG70771.1 fumarylacetoacetate hydrolase [Paracidovorax citrulli]RLJ95323.1 fumarylacetoacetate hydrolase [Paracidovorax citrulli]
MPQHTDATHDPSLRSWVESANAAGCDFPIQNLPFGRFRAHDGSARIGVAIGDRILDIQAAGLVAGDDMNALMAAGPQARRALRTRLSQGLAAGSAQQAAWQDALLPQAGTGMLMPCRIGDYTDFYTSVHHATNVGRQFRPDNPLLPNYQWVPIGYHGRASSIGVSGAAVRRPRGQLKAPEAAAPVLAPSRRLDYELELGWFVGTGNAQGEPIGIGEAEDHLFGVALFNDWSARDIQGWEYQPLGPFLSKNFASTLSPWVVTLEALAPFRAPFTRPDEDPQPLPYLDSPDHRAAGAFAITLEVLLQTERMRTEGLPPAVLSRTDTTRAAYWTPAQLVAHHTVNGCNLHSGDLLGSGTLSGPGPQEAGSLLELAAAGRQPVRLPSGEERSFLEDGDTVTLRGWCEREGAARIGLGEASGTVTG